MTATAKAASALVSDVKTVTSPNTDPKPTTAITTDTRLQAGFSDWVKTARSAIDALVRAQKHDGDNDRDDLKKSHKFDLFDLAIMRVMSAIRGAERLSTDDAKGGLEIMSVKVDADILEACRQTARPWFPTHAKLGSMFEKRRLLTDVARRNSYLNHRNQTASKVASVWRSKLRWMRAPEELVRSGIKADVDEGEALCEPAEWLFRHLHQHTPREHAAGGVGVWPFESRAGDEIRLDEKTVQQAVNKMHTDLDLVSPLRLTITRAVSWRVADRQSTSAMFSHFHWAGSHYADAFLSHEATEVHSGQAGKADAYMRARIRCNTLLYLIDTLKHDANGLMWPVAFRSFNGLMVTLLFTLLQYVAPDTRAFSMCRTPELNRIVEQAIRREPLTWCDYAIQRIDAVQHRPDYLWTDLTFDIEPLKAEVCAGLGRILKGFSSLTDSNYSKESAEKLKAATQALDPDRTLTYAEIMSANHAHYITSATSEEDASVATARMLFSLYEWIHKRPATVTATYGPMRLFGAGNTAKALISRSNESKHALYDPRKAFAGVYTPDAAMQFSQASTDVGALRYEFQAECVREAFRIGDLIRLEVGRSEAMKTLQYSMRVLVSMALTEAFLRVSLQVYMSYWEEGKGKLFVDKSVSPSLYDAVVYAYWSSMRLLGAKLDG